MVKFENPSFEGAIIGVTTDDRYVYSYEQMIHWLMKEEDWSEEDAIDWIDYNTIRSLGYIEDAPVIMYEYWEE